VSTGLALGGSGLVALVTAGPAALPILAASWLVAFLAAPIWYLMLLRSFE
jgi:hypothetical protein